MSADGKETKTALVLVEASPDVPAQSNPAEGQGRGDAKWRFWLDVGPALAFDLGLAVLFLRNLAIYGDLQWRYAMGGNAEWSDFGLGSGGHLTMRGVALIVGYGAVAWFNLAAAWALYRRAKPRPRHSLTRAE
ncbi:hypothetical protein [Novosphingobium sp. FKTRR1]|uniref:hypothetical protein n=1 Tax=Novosphingobium sp. FKTRR1 TaxID=2879118 RepID=UPI001CEFC3BC|nr:hypothetical protein [Novosphingobium sp. FKTRR1]